MRGLREEIISIICKEWPNSEDELNEVAIHERLVVAGVEASEDDVRQVLLQLSDHQNITLVVDPRSGLVVQDVGPELCP